jgi:translation initiation factor 5A
MDSDGSQKSDVKVPEGEVGEKLQAAFDEGKELSKDHIARVR